MTGLGAGLAGWPPLSRQRSRGQPESRLATLPAPSPLHPPSLPSVATVPAFGTFCCWSSSGFRRSRKDPNGPSIRMGKAGWGQTVRQLLFLVTRLTVCLSFLFLCSRSVPALAQGQVREKTPLLSGPRNHAEPPYPRGSGVVTALGHRCCDRSGTSGEKTSPVDSRIHWAL